MAIPSFILPNAINELKTIEMHTTGEPTRIVYSGFPDLKGSLLKQRAQARDHHDNIRKALICEPRGHREMYGAALRQSTELVDAGEAHMGVLFLTNDGYSTMCGHATIALGKMLVDCDDASIFPKRNNLDFEATPGQVELKLHVPCGLVTVMVPTVRSADGKWRSHPDARVSYLSVPSFVAGIEVDVPIPGGLQWPALKQSTSVTVDVAYGGAFYIFCSPAALGFDSSLAKPDFAALNLATRNLKRAFNDCAALRPLLAHPDHQDLEFLYSVILTDRSLGTPCAGSSRAETGLCFFSDQQVDRSPTGSGVQARVALAYAKGELKLGEERTYHSLVTHAYGGQDGFTGSVAREVEVGRKEAVLIEVSGRAYYTGACTFFVENGDAIGKGFWFEDLCR